ncbi:uncharacterized protein LOC131293218 [Anopheles ziemanni]|uniref:uncharacterized protein LOC131261852 n=1 Tax=Anopheles coustani TaxID=139045 RepID=UPI00265ACA03|nr:uncharacterized protein LOC131261852 [Anopheles coustani]XP_058177284.1 uncharacterized protein LOC131293218 [Anopheles ziemanni]
MYNVWLLSLCAALTVALQGMFESFEQSGEDVVFLDLRVRKINRTTSPLNGTAIVRVPLGNDIQLSMDLFHSRLGNNQFNHYPMKLPSAGNCDFIKNMHINYKEQLTLIENFPGEGECPVSPRTVEVRDYVFPSEVLPAIAPRGLWKATITYLSMDLFYSRLGNNQFNHYPMKLPSAGTCDFIKNMHNNYKDHVNQLENYPDKDECPISPRTIIIRDYVFPSEVIPPLAPRGLWKAILTGVRSEEVVMGYTLLLTVSDYS